MPYTPPTQRSPATSKPSSPILSRTHSYADQYPPSPALSQRPALPRSVSSTSYLNKHRRSSSSSIASNTAANTQSNVATSSPDVPRAHGPSAHGSLRPSPPPVNNSLIPSGAITTPPDSSDDDEDRERNSRSLRELQEALQQIPVKRQSSPNRDGSAVTSANSAASNAIARPLSANARKISHSRSSSEMMLSKHNVSLNTDSLVVSSTDGSDEEDDGLRMKPQLLRKKSGELVKPALRPASRRRPSSMPGTPTYSKAVHFNEDIEQVRHFLQIDRPIAVSAGSSPVETYDSESEYPFFDGRKEKEPEWDIKLANFPSDDSYERQTLPVRVERIFLASDNKTLVGTVACANISFHKLVVARFTLDYWKTTSEVVAEYNHDVRRKQKEDGYDRFNFNIKLADQANLESKTLLLCVRYQVNGQEFWDNNGSINYQVDFIKKTRQAPHKGSSGTLRAIPRSRHSPSGPRPRSMPAGSFDDDFGSDFGSKFAFGTSRAQFKDSPSASIRLKPKSKRGSLYPDQANHQQPAGQAFSTRYDFSASLSAALSNAQTALGDRSGLTPNGTNKGSKDYFNQVASNGAPKVNAGPVPGTRPGGLSTDKPDLKSAEYNELIQKFCFFGTPSKGSPSATTPASKNSHTDGATEYILGGPSGSGSNTSSASNSPPSPALPILVDGASDGDLKAATRSPFTSRSTSPGPVTGPDHIASSFQYGYAMHGGIFPEASHTPQACV